MNFHPTNIQHSEEALGEITEYYNKYSGRGLHHDI